MDQNAQSLIVMLMVINNINFTSLHRWTVIRNDGHLLKSTAKFRNWSENTQSWGRRQEVICSVESTNRTVSVFTVEDGDSAFSKTLVSTARDRGKSRLYVVWLATEFWDSHTHVLIRWQRVELFVEFPSFSCSFQFQEPDSLCWRQTSATWITGWQGFRYISAPILTDGLYKTHSWNVGSCGTV